MTARDDLTQIAADALRTRSVPCERREREATIVLDALAAHPDLLAAYTIETGALKATVWHYEPGDTAHPHRVCNDRCRTVYRVADGDQ